MPPKARSLQGEQREQHFQSVLHDFCISQGGEQNRGCTQLSSGSLSETERKRLFFTFSNAFPFSLLQLSLTAIFAGGVALAEFLPVFHSNGVRSGVNTFSDLLNV